MIKKHNTSFPGMYIKPRAYDGTTSSGTQLWKNMTTMGKADTSNLMKMSYKYIIEYIPKHLRSTRELSLWPYVFIESDQMCMVMLMRWSSMHSIKQVTDDFIIAMSYGGDVKAYVWHSNRPYVACITSSRSRMTSLLLCHMEEMLRPSYGRATDHM